MQDKGYQFISETDTEVLAHLLDYYYKGNPLEAITKVLHRVEGSYALGIMFADQPDKIFAARKNTQYLEALFLGFPQSCQRIRRLTGLADDNDHIALLQDGITITEEDGLRFFSVDEEEITKTPVTIDWDANAAEKGGYEHFMLKEIYEQPKYRDSCQTFNDIFCGNTGVICGTAGHDMDLCDLLNLLIAQEVVELKEDGLRFFSVDEEEITKTPVTIDWDANAYAEPQATIWIFVIS